MQLSGILETIPLPDLTQLIANGRKSGTLVVSRDHSVMRFVFRDGELIGILRGNNGSPDDDLPAWLVKDRLLSPSESETLVTLAKRRGSTITRTLIDTGVLRSTDLEKALYERTLRLFTEIMAWPGGTFDFRDSGDDELAMEGAPVRIEKLLMHSL